MTCSLMIMNAGPLPTTWTLDTPLAPHRPLPPNPDIANAFCRAGYIDGWGRGFEEIVAACRREGFPDPIVTYDGSGLCVAFPYAPAHVWASFDIGTDPATVHVTPPVTPQVTPQDTPQDTPQVTPQVQRLVETVSGEMHRTELMAALALRDRMHFANGYLTPALTAGLIEMTIPDKPNSRLQKYRLTAQGRALLVARSTP